MLPANALDDLVAAVADAVAERVIAALDVRATTAAEGELWHLLTTEELATRLGRSQRWIREKAKSGELPWIRLDGGALAFDLADVQEFARARRVPELALRRLPALAGASGGRMDSAIPGRSRRGKPEVADPNGGRAR